MSFCVRAGNIEISGWTQQSGIRRKNPNYSLSGGYIKKYKTEHNPESAD